MIRRPPRSTLSSSSAASDVYKRQIVLTVLGFVALTSQPQNLKEVPISGVIERANNGKVAKIEGQGNAITVTPKGEDKPTEKSYIQGGVSTLLKENVLSKEAKSAVSD